MSQDAHPQEGQKADDVDRTGTDDGLRQEPRELIRESIKYRRRAQDAERRVETLEAELEALRQERDAGAEGLRTELAEARTETDGLKTRLERLETERRLERELAQAGCADVETAVAVARDRLADDRPPEDLGTFARELLEEKPHLRGTPPPELPAATRSPRPGSSTTRRAAMERLADEGRSSGRPTDLQAYMRARRGTSP